MPRKGPAPKRQILPDGRFNSKVLARFINKVMLRGKKSTAEHITYGALNIVAEKTGRDPMEVFSQALSNAMPLVEVLRISEQIREAEDGIQRCPQLVVHRGNVLGGGEFDAEHGMDSFTRRCRLLMRRRDGSATSPSSATGRRFRACSTKTRAEACQV